MALKSVPDFFLDCKGLFPQTPPVIYIRDVFG